MTWKECRAERGEYYRIYRNHVQITSNNLHSSQLIREIPKGSANFYCNRFNEHFSGRWRPRYLSRYVIEKNGPQIAPETGLLVWTIHEDDAPGNAPVQSYYAITCVNRYGIENIHELGPANTTGPVTENTEDSAPVEFETGLDSKVHGYIQYMDICNWNATFHAPNPLNDYYGQNPSQGEFRRAQQYAYDYLVFEPVASLEGDRANDPAPVVLYLHGHVKSAYPPDIQRPQYFENAYVVQPFDIGETWYFGFAQKNDYRIRSIPLRDDRIVNYTEQRILRMIRDLIKQPPGPPVDEHRIYVYGHSMGGSGALAFALRYPKIFAAAYACQPMTDYQLSGRGGGVSWISDLETKFGKIEDNLPIRFTGLADWMDHLKVHEDRGIWDWQNHVLKISSNPKEESAPFGITHGMTDNVIEWSTQGRSIYKALNDSKRTWSGGITLSDHRWMHFYGLSPTLMPDKTHPFFGGRVIRNETMPGFSNLSQNPPALPDGPGGYNLTIRWSSSWDSWDAPPVDEPDRWEMSFCTSGDEVRNGLCGSGKAQTVDITPRRLQKFKVDRECKYRWVNKDVGDGRIVDAGFADLDENNLLTVRNFNISLNGNRLIIEAVREHASGVFIPGDK